MATSGSKSVSATAHTTLRFSWSQSSQSVSNNTTTISWKLEEIQSSGYISSSASKSWSVTVNGSNYSGTNTVGINSNSTRTLASGNTTIGHNADGSKSFSYSFSQQFDINYNGTWIGTVSGSSSGTLNTIPRASSVSATNANIGSAITITISRASSSFTHTLRYSFHSLNGTIANGVGTSKSWTLPTTFYTQIPNAKSSWGTIYCDTYSGSTLIGTKSCTFNVYVNESSSKPTISPTVKDTNSTTLALTGDENIFIKYYSSANFAINATARNSATLSKTSVVVGSQSTSNATGTFQNVDSASFVFSATDSRGFTTSQTVNKTLINYVKLTCSMANNTPTASGEMVVKATGNYFNGSFGSVSNTLSVQYQYSKNDGTYSSWSDLTITLSGNTYTATKTLTGLDYQSSYTFKVRAVDRLATVTTSPKTVKSTPIFDWGENNFHFHVPVFVNGNEMFHNGNCQVSSSGGCTSWRFPNGMQVSIVKAWGTWNVTTAWGAVYSSNHIAGQPFDVPFSEPPVVTINAYNENSTAMMVCSTSAPTTTTTCACYLWKPVSQTGVKTYIEYIAVGKWK